jgi:hypothetical protein
MATYQGTPGSFLANSALSVNRAVVLSNNRGVGLAGNTVVPLGFTIGESASGDYADVRFFAGPGTHKCVVTGAPITVGDTVYAAGSGYVSATGTVAIGKTLTTSLVNDAIIEFVPTF